MEPTKENLNFNNGDKGVELNICDVVHDNKYCRNSLAKLQDTGPLIYIPLNNNSIHCYILRSTKDSDKCK